MVYVFSLSKFFYFPNILQCSTGALRMKFSNSKIVQGNKLAETGAQEIKCDLC